MKRRMMNELVAWKDLSSRKPLLLQGARQVGKTFLLEQFGIENFRRMHYLNLEDPVHASLFERGPFDTESIILEMEFELAAEIERGEDVVFIDEIQESPKAINSLKYFCEKHPDLAVCCAGSHIGIEGARGAFPVGKVNFLGLFPMSFDEFLEAVDTRLHGRLHRCIDEMDFPENVHTKLLEAQKIYTLVGGLPEAVKDFVETDADIYGKLKTVRERHKELLRGYELDFAKYSEVVNAHRVSAVFQNIPMQIQKVMDNSIGRFLFKDVLPGQSKYVHLRGPIDWLIHSGLARKISVANNASVPPKAYTKENMFKLVGLDIGLFCTQLDLDFKTVVAQTIGAFKGFIAEAFVAQEFIARKVSEELVSWKEGESEVEYLINFDGHVVPVEVKSGTRVRAKSLNLFKKKYSPSLSVKLSAKSLRYEKEARQLNAPLYLAGYLKTILEKISG